MFKLNSLKAMIPESVSSLLGNVKTILLYSTGILKKYRVMLWKASLFKTISFPLGLSIIYITRATLDKGIFSKDLSAFLKFSVLGLCVFFPMLTLQYLINGLTAKAKAKFSLDVNHDFTKRLFDLDYLKIRQLSSAENSFILDYDHRIIENLVLDELPSLASLVKIPVFLVLSFMLSVPLTLLVLVTLPFIALHTAWTSKRRKKYRAKELYYSRKHFSILHDILLNIKLIKSFFKENWALERVTSLFRDRTNASLKSSLFFRRARFISDLFTKFNTVVFWLLGGYLIIKGPLTFGSFSAVSMYTALIISELDNLSGVIQELNEERSSIARSAAFISQITGRAEGSHNSDSIKNLEFDKDIEFRDVTFGYKKDDPLFERLSFCAPAGKWTLIRGVSGVGKTSLLSLFLRLFFPEKGGIFIGGHDIRRIDRALFSGNISVVHQEPYLFNDTLINNILLGEKKEKGPIEKVLQCAKLDELVASLSMGYNSRVGEAGFSLSGGQRQRIAIARALAREPKILILDEATSFIDSKTEREIFGNIRRSYPSITVMFVTHRDTALKFADEILVLEEGNIKRGDHERILPGKKP
ncbi:MAG: ABC transporter ATP-binding protein [Candidatus Omnitrophota bacterium]